MCLYINSSTFTYFLLYTRSSRERENYVNCFTFHSTCKAVDEFFLSIFYLRQIHPTLASVSWKTAVLVTKFKKLFFSNVRAGFHVSGLQIISWQQEAGIGIHTITWQRCYNILNSQFSGITSKSALSKQQFCHLFSPCVLWVFLMHSPSPLCFLYLLSFHGCR